jgi:hypothetical protein
MYENEARTFLDALSAHVPGRSSATTVGPTATVRFYVSPTNVVVNAMVMNGRIMLQATTEPQGAIVWGIKEYPSNEDGAREAANYAIAWARRQGYAKPIGGAS